MTRVELYPYIYTNRRDRRPRLSYKGWTHHFRIFLCDVSNIFISKAEEFYNEKAENDGNNTNL